jgi:hypothetical protein
MRNNRAALTVMGIGARIRTNAVMTGLVPVIHVVTLPERFRLAGNGAAWMAGTSPAMTEGADQEAQGSPTSPNALAFGRMTGTSPVMTAPAEISPLNIQAWEG